MGTKISSSIFFRLALVMGVIFFSGSLLLGWTAWKIRESIRAQELKKLEIIVTAKADLLDAQTDSMITSVKNLGQIFTNMYRISPDALSSFSLDNSKSFTLSMKRYLAQNNFHDIIFLSPKGQILYTYNRSIDLNTNIFSGPYKNSYLASTFKDALSNKPPKVSQFSYYIPSSNYAAFIGIPIVLHNKTVGVVAVQLQNEALHRVVNNYQGLGKSGDVHVAVVRHNNCTYMASSRFDHHPAFSIDQQDDNHPLILASRGIEGSKYYVDKTGTNVGAAWKYIPKLHWAIMVKMPESELLSEWNKQSRILIFEYSLLYLTVMAILYYLYISVRKPLYTILQGTQSFADGKFDVKILLDRRDEIGILAKTYNMMADRIRRDISDLNEKNEHLSHQKKTIESLNEELEKKFNEKSRQLLNYIRIVDENVITSTTNLNGTITSVSQAFCRISGYSAEELIGRYHNVVRHPDMTDTFFQDLWNTISAGHTWHGEVKNRRKDGTYYWVDTVITPNYEDGKPVGYTSIRQDITDRKRAEELAITDALTGLYNRRHFNLIVEKELNRAKRNNATLSIIILDIDYFKQYNDNYGHLAGDTILVEISKVLLNYSHRANDYSFRFGGEEFAILMYGMNYDDTFALGEFIRKSIESLELPHGFSLVAPFVTVSIGIAMDQAVNIESFDQLFKRADNNLYFSKAHGRNRVTFK